MFSLFNASCGEVQPYPLRKKTAMVFNSIQPRKDGAPGFILQKKSHCKVLK